LGLPTVVPLPSPLVAHPSRTIAGFGSTVTRWGARQGVTSGGCRVKRKENRLEAEPSPTRSRDQSTRLITRTKAGNKQTGGYFREEKSDGRLGGVTHFYSSSLESLVCKFQPQGTGNREQGSGVGSRRFALVPFVRCSTVNSVRHCLRHRSAARQRTATNTPTPTASADGDTTESPNAATRPGCRSSQRELRESSFRKRCSEAAARRCVPTYRDPPRVKPCSTRDARKNPPFQTKISRADPQPPRSSHPSSRV
jgi:hypothetical protein